MTLEPDGSGRIPPHPTGSIGPPPAPAAASLVFGDRLELARRYAAHLADTGISHGLIGPREVDRLWQRHILNCAVVAQAIPEAAEVIDVGSGAGLPGLCLAIARPDLSVTLVEPMERRTAWLRLVCDDLGLDTVTIERARAEELHGRLTAGVVTARAVAALDKLARWCLPLVAPGGKLVAMKGSSARDEVHRAEATLRRLGGTSTSVRSCGSGIIDPPTTVVVIEKAALPHPDGLRLPAHGGRKPSRGRTGRG